MRIFVSSFRHRLPVCALAVAFAMLAGCRTPTGASATGPKADSPKPDRTECVTRWEDCTESGPCEVSGLDWQQCMMTAQCEEGSACPACRRQREVVEACARKKCPDLMPCLPWAK